MNLSQTFETELIALLPRLRRFAHGLCRDSADADDLTQMCVERAFRSRDQWTPGTRLDSWAYRILRNLWIDTARSRSRKRKFEAPPEEAENVGQDPRGQIESSLDLQRAMAAMECLPDEQREIVALIDRGLWLSRGIGNAKFADRYSFEPAGARPHRFAGDIGWRQS